MSSCKTGHKSNKSLFTNFIFLWSAVFPLQALGLFVISPFTGVGVKNPVVTLTTSVILLCSMFDNYYRWRVDQAPNWFKVTYATVAVGVLVSFNYLKNGTSDSFFLVMGLAYGWLPFFLGLTIYQQVMFRRRTDTAAILDRVERMVEGWEKTILPAPLGEMTGDGWKGAPHQDPFDPEYLAEQGWDVGEDEGCDTGDRDDEDHPADPAGPRFDVIEGGKKNED